MYLNFKISKKPDQRAQQLVDGISKRNMAGAVVCDIKRQFPKVRTALSS